MSVDRAKRKTYAEVAAERRVIVAERDPMTWYKPVTKPDTSHAPVRGTTTLKETDARMVANRLERIGWRAEYFPSVAGTAYVEVQDLSQRGHPKIATIRTPDDERTFLASHPNHGPRGRGAPRSRPRTG